MNQKLSNRTQRVWAVFELEVLNNLDKLLPKCITDAPKPKGVQIYYLQSSETNITANLRPLILCLLKTLTSWSVDHDVRLAPSK